MHPSTEIGLMEVGGCCLIGVSWSYTYQTTATNLHQPNLRGWMHPYWFASQYGLFEPPVRSFQLHWSSPRSLPAPHYAMSFPGHTTTTHLPFPFFLNSKPSWNLPFPFLIEPHHAPSTSTPINVVSVVLFKLSNICSLVVTLRAMFGILCISILEFNHVLALLIGLVPGYRV